MGLFGKIKDAMKNDEDDNERDFKYLDRLIHSGEKVIVLDSDICKNGKLRYQNGIKVNVDDITIDGNGYTIDAQKAGSIFLCTGKNITIKNLTLKNGYSIGSGGVINNNRELTLINCRLEDNFSMFGGAINNQGELTIRDSVFKRNTAENDGGVINNYRSRINIENTTFERNICQRGFGGVIKNHKGVIEIADSTFHDNGAYWGGAIFNNKGGMKFTNSTFTENVVINTGGAILNNDDSQVILIGCTFAGNIAEKDGGAVYTDSDELTIKNCKFRENIPNDVN